jgi:hypothetical protein
VRIRATALAIAPILCAQTQIPAPDAAEQQAIIARMKEAAATYNDRLQDFLATQTMTRSTASTGAKPRWKVLETQESELSYVGHKVNSKLLKVNGKTTDLDKQVKRGYFIFSGEFGALQWVFNPKTIPEFEWDHGEVSEGKRLCVFRYRTPEANTNFVFYSDGDKTPAGHHGLVLADCDTGMAVRFHLETDPAAVRRRGRDVPLGYELDVRYAPATIAGQEFLLPQVAEETSLFNTRLTKAEVRFQQYRKYDTNSTITFDDRQ